MALELVILALKFHKIWQHIPPSCQSVRAKSRNTSINLLAKWRCIKRSEIMSRRQEIGSPPNTTKLAEGDLSLRVFHEVDENAARRKHHFLVGGDQQVHHHLVNCNTHACVCIVLCT